MYELYRKNRPDATPIDVYVDFCTHQWMWVDTTRRIERQLALHGNAPVYTYIFRLRVRSSAFSADLVPSQSDPWNGGCIQVRPS